MKNKARIPRILRAALLLALLFYLSAPAVWATPDEDCAAGRHQYAELRRVEATAMEDGEISYLCGNCGQRYTEILYATSHLWGEWVTDSPATCTEQGTRRRTCTRGQIHDEQGSLPALGHNYLETVTEPGCEEEGLRTFSCSRCRDVYTEPIPATGHAYEEFVSEEPACMTPGLKSFICENNPAHVYEESIPAIGSHAFGEWQTRIPAEEGAQGLEIRICTRCGLEEPRTLPALPTLPATTAAPPEPPDEIPVLDIVLVGASALSLGFFAFLLIPFFLCFAYIKKRQEAVKRRDELQIEVDKKYGFK
ncbi:MAG: hypothetical protein FWH26_06265 [Oscillospiraceae bacterium]|nr:hypothetical protein [Oscillospiraceae bacterium]